MLLRHSQGDYTPDPEQAKYPALQLTEQKRPFKTLWLEFCEAKKISASAKKKWRPYFSALMLRVGSTDMNVVTEQHLLDWRDALLATKLSPIIVRDGYIAAAKAFFGWCKRMKKTDRSARKQARHPRERLTSFAVVADLRSDHAAEIESAMERILIEIMSGRVLIITSLLRRSCSPSFFCQDAPAQPLKRPQCMQAEDSSTATPLCPTPERKNARTGCRR